MKKFLVVLLFVILTITMLSFNGTVPPEPKAAAAEKPTTSIPITTTTLVSAIVMEKWTKVAWCETHGNWSFNGSRYDGGLGIVPGNWIHFGGLQFAPAAHLATSEQQVVIARRIQGSEYVPDQNNTCSAW
jgi:predicted secreted protein